MPRQQKWEVVLVPDAVPDEAEAAAQEARRLVAQRILRSMGAAGEADTPPEVDRD